MRALQRSRTHRGARRGQAAEPHRRPLRAAAGSRHPARREYQEETARDVVRLGLTYNLKPAGAELAVADNDQFEEFDSVETIEALESAIRAAGHEPIRLGWGLEMLETLQRERVDGVFNIAEGVGGRGRESQVPAVLEMLGIPCTGSDALAIALTLDKALAKIVAKSAGIATAPWFVHDLPSASTDKSVCATSTLPNVAQTLLSVPGQQAAPDVDLTF